MPEYEDLDSFKDEIQRMLGIVPTARESEKEMPSLNHSYICLEVLLQLAQNPALKPLPELTLDIDKGIIPDISVYPADKVQPDFFHDVPRYQLMPTLAIEIISASQNIQDLLDKALMLIAAGVKAVWTIEPFTQTVFISTEKGHRIVHNQAVESEGISVDFTRIFAVN